MRSAGFSEGEVAEIIAHVALNVFTNYFNVATDVDIDFSQGLALASVLIVLEAPGSRCL